MTADLAAQLASAMTVLDPPAVIVTAVADGHRAGCLATFSMQCSMQPFRYLVGISRANATYRIADAAGSLAVHIPPPDAVALAELFGGASGDDTDKFALAAWRPWEDGTPLLDGCSWFAGPVVVRAALGDHVGMVIEPVMASGAPAAPGLRLRDVRHIRPGHAV